MPITKQGIVPHVSSINWREIPSDNEFESALKYLKLIFLPEDAIGLYLRLIDNPHKVNATAGDILRASASSGPILQTPKILSIIRQINRGEELSPPLLVQSPRTEKIHIAHGYETICAVQCKNSDFTIPCLTTAWES